MTLPLIATFGQAIFKLLLGGTAIFLILLVLVQRGRGGGLAGALGGMGGSSAFGAKAGDVFTRVTIIAATFWIVLCIVAAKLVPSNQSRLNTNVSATVSSTAEVGPAIEAVGKADDAEVEPAAEATADGADDGGEAPPVDAEQTEP